MTVEELIKMLRKLREIPGPNRVHATELIHKLERYSLGTEVVLPVATDFEKASKSYDVDIKMKNSKLVITAAK